MSKLMILWFSIVGIVAISFFFKAVCHLVATKNNGTVDAFGVEKVSSNACENDDYVIKIDDDHKWQDYINM